LNEQQLRPLVPTERLKRLASDEHVICLVPTRAISELCSQPESNLPRAISELCSQPESKRPRAISELCSQPESKRPRAISELCSQPESKRPLFGTIADEESVEGSVSFWKKYGSIHQIDPAKALVIADFGLGSDTAVILDYARDPINPPVLRLRWSERGKNNQWVQCAKDFDEFAEILGLGQK
jgi:hypothetical protein